MRVQEFKVNVEGHEATVTAKSSGWLRKKEKVEYNMSQIPRKLLRAVYSMLAAHIAEKLKKRPFEFHIHLPHP